MENVEVEDSDFSSIVDMLVNMFGNVLNKDVITAVVENCAGDLNMSAEAIMNMTEGNSSLNTESVTCPITFDSNENNATTDLILFTNRDNSSLRPREVEVVEEDVKPSLDNVLSSTSTIGPLRNDASSLRENDQSEPKLKLNIDAPSFVPQTINEETNTNTYSKAIANSVGTSGITFGNPSRSSIKYTESRPNTDNNTFESFISYSDLARKTGALPKKIITPKKQESDTTLSPQLRRVADYHSQNIRTLIIMRGAPGSGKSYLSRQLIQVTVGDNDNNYKNHVFSTDDFFTLRGFYEFDKYRLRDAHDWNMGRSSFALEAGTSPIIIDNTNIELWEMEPYVRFGVKNGYKIVIMEPQTPWAKKPHQLMKRNIHGVPLSNIRRMLDNYVENVNGDFLINYFKLSYPDNMNPPVLRKIPPPKFAPILSNEQVVAKNITITNNQISSANLGFVERESTVDEISYHNTVIETNRDENNFNTSVQTVDNTESNLELLQLSTSTVTKTDFPESTFSFKNYDKTNENSKNLTVNSNIQKQMEDFERLDIEWENNPPWDDNTTSENGNGKRKWNESKWEMRTDPRPPRDLSPRRSGSNQNATYLHAVNHCPNWEDISMFLQPWSNGAQSTEKEPVIPVELKSSGTSVERGDTDIYNNQTIYKVISATPRDINENFISPYREKIPEKRMLDKSSMTNDRLITDVTRCKNEERHFIAFRKMFKTVSKAGLRDIFDQCRGDVNWAVEIVLDGLSNNQLQFTDEIELSDIEEEDDPEQCTCLAAYNIVPDGEVRSKDENTDNIPESITENVHSIKKPKREVPPSEMSIQLKRQIEKNVVISDSHYSDHCLKIRKQRRGEFVSEIEENACALVPYQQDQDSSAVDEDDESSTSLEENEKIININVGYEFIRSMDELYGRSGITYPESVVPKLSIPISIVNELNALWMESLMHQLDENDKQSEALVKQDEEFARQLAAKELEMAQAGKEPEVPDFKEIMDMEFAMSLYQRDVDEWRNKVPDNLAAKLSRDKLFNLFPDLPQETLSELLVAHDNNFKTTVEVLLMSTGKSEVLEKKDGLVKFVMTKEIERKEKIVEEEKKALSEAEWPLLPKGVEVDMGTVNEFRKNAEQHLERRNKSYDMAQQYIQRGMTSVAVYFSDLANFHKQMFDQANSRAAATLIQVHAQNSPNNATIDLHYLRVSEALETLDLFLDSHISRLRESQAANRGPRCSQLFFITGRGLHSKGGPKIKPAVKRRLGKRGIGYRVGNPGLLCARVTADDMLSHQVEL